MDNDKVVHTLKLALMALRATEFSSEVSSESGTGWSLCPECGETSTHDADCPLGMVIAAVTQCLDELDPQIIPSIPWYIDKSTIQEQIAAIK